MKNTKQHWGWVHAFEKRVRFFFKWASHLFSNYNIFFILLGSSHFSEGVQINYILTLTTNQVALCALQSPSYSAQRLA